MYNDIYGYGCKSVRDENYSDGYNDAKEDFENAIDKVEETSKELWEECEQRVKDLNLPEELTEKILDIIGYYDDNILDALYKAKEDM